MYKACSLVVGLGNISHIIQLIANCKSCCERSVKLPLFCTYKSSVSLVHPSLESSAAANHLHCWNRIWTGLKEQTTNKMDVCNGWCRWLLCVVCQWLNVFPFIYCSTRMSSQFLWLTTGPRPSSCRFWQGITAWHRVFLRYGLYFHLTLSLHVNCWFPPI